MTQLDPEAERLSALAVSPRAAKLVGTAASTLARRHLDPLDLARALIAEGTARLQEASPETAVAIVTGTAEPDFIGELLAEAAARLMLACGREAGVKALADYAALLGRRIHG